MDNQYLIVLENQDSNGEQKRITSYWMGVNGKTWEELEDKAKEAYPGKVYIRDLTGTIHDKLADGRLVWKDGFAVEPTPYVPTAAEVEEAALKALDAEYATKLEEAKQAVTDAAIIEQDEELAEELRSDYQSIKNEYVEKRGAING